VGEQFKFCGFWKRVDWFINANISEKHAVPIFQAKVKR
jgi:hypothetical protein